MTIKKAYVEIVEFLEANENSKVKTILDAVKDMCSAKSGGGGGGSSFRKDDDGNVTAIFCYYHKKWEDPNVVEFGKKATSPTGMNNMCKEGTSQWTKQHRAAKKAKEDLLNQVATGEVAPEDIAKHQEAIDAAMNEIVPREDGHGTDE